MTDEAGAHRGAWRGGGVAAVQCPGRNPNGPPPVISVCRGMLSRGENEEIFGVLLRDMAGLLGIQASDHAPQPVRLDQRGREVFA
jgi:hypothetical protein